MSVTALHQRIWQKNLNQFIKELLQVKDYATKGKDLFWHIPSHEDPILSIKDGEKQDFLQLPIVCTGLVWQ